MLTSKQRAFLRGLANKIDATIQIGKGGISENSAALVSDALEKHELVKVHVLDNAFADPREVCKELADMTGAEPVQVIGGKFVLYRQSAENRRIYLDKLIVKAEPEQTKKSVKPGYKAKAARLKAIEEEQSKKKRIFQKKRRHGKTYRRPQGKKIQKCTFGIWRQIKAEV